MFINCDQDSLVLSNFYRQASYMELNFDFYSPEQALVIPSAVERGIKISIKRDDLIHPYISGNKWRKLKYPLQKAREQEKSKLVTFGGAWSNHLLATACAGAQFKFKTIGYVRGEQVYNPVLNLCRLFGMDLRFVSREMYRDKHNLFDRNHKHDSTAFFIDEGGYSADGAKGCEEIISELKDQYDHLFVACGTGTTLAGISQGASLYCPHAQVHGIPVLKGGSFIENAVKSIYPNANFRLHLDYHFGGYAKTTPPLISFIQDFCQNTGILIEPVYTGKLLFGIQKLIEKGHFSSGDRLCVIHTGGLTGFLGFQTNFLLDLDRTNS
ncbi:1-aminocyclopropane-1-carboxylate deaminase/D-cysteine desulfhydrase [Albibacterium indicum]|uniref:1-aminocyclopropane-1-carboxylate deaminase/D-cysteine desulfhydrase n=1 Tax=Albibacterium indicum TaxID=2292082 RepID=UPI0029374619|nr:pyridoxal-phosphate dependent enzyme [Pedobacter indicus]